MKQETTCDGKVVLESYPGIINWGDAKNMLYKIVFVDEFNRSFWLLCVILMVIIVFDE